MGKIASESLVNPVGRRWRSLMIPLKLSLFMLLVKISRSHVVGDSRRQIADGMILQKRTPTTRFFVTTHNRPAQRILESHHRAMLGFRVLLLKSLQPLFDPCALTFLAALSKRIPIPQ